ncbi:hypothetical protein IAE40_13870 [Pseudomonas sp. S44]|uniref:hypothetical protein n=1 Tax=unclassified Pseudomonas TaxID=196821 RepID=UPI00129AF24A|nr:MULTISPECIES: hypothetical protein [unclassified Pseudomonas]MBK0059726.1 hypothetical protein [Pseudomonas sp. S44]
MSKLKINRLKIISRTNEGNFGADIPFSYGLNIIRADNTLGKSTCVQSIVYALGLEGNLGPSRKSPLKSALTTRLKKADGCYALVTESKIYLEISNINGKVITVARSSIEEKNRIISVYEKSINEINFLSDSTFSDFFVRDPGSAARERGFHNFLEKFLDIEDPQVVKYDGSTCPLYLESIFSVNYVEQTRGWGGILNVLPTYLGIKDLASRVLEYNLALDIQENNRKRQLLAVKKNDLEATWALSVERLVSAAKQVYAFADSSISDEIGKQDSVNSTTNLYVLDPQLQKINLFDHLIALKSELLALKKESTSSEGHGLRVQTQEKELGLLMNRLSEEESAISILLSDIDISEDYVRSIEKRISSVKEGLRKYRDIKKIQEYGSTESFKFLEGQCPTCNQPIQDSLLPHMHNQSALGIDDNIKYLEKQVSVFESLRKGEENKALAKRTLILRAQDRVNFTRSEIRSLKESLIDVKGAPSRAQLRKEILLEAKVEAIERTLNIESEIKEKLISTKLEWSNVAGAISKLPWDGFSRNDYIKLSVLTEQFKENLSDFEYKSTSIEDFEISKRTYKPAIDDVDLGSEASASDNIRVIWAYLYSLLTLDFHLNGLTTNHLGVLMLDEPRQQETKEVNFKTFIERASETRSMERQVIIATSEKHDDLKKMIEGLPVNVIDFQGPLISKI